MLGAWILVGAGPCMRRVRASRSATSFRGSYLEFIRIVKPTTSGRPASRGVLHGTFAPRSRRRKDDLTSLRELRALSKPQDHRPSHLDLRASLQKERLCLPRRGTVGVPSVGKVDVFGMLVVGSSL